MTIKVRIVVFVVGSTIGLLACSEQPSTTVVAVVKSNELMLPEKITAQAEPIPKFGEIAHIPEKKSKFFNYLQKRVEQTNDYVWAERQFVLKYRNKLLRGGVNAREQKLFDQLVERYGFDAASIKEEADFQRLLTRVDVVPESLVLAQGANESAWGTSRFATEGKNFFGIWCYKEGCGIKPRRRNSGSSHEVRKFETVQEGVNFYVHNINVGHAYDMLRATRAELRSDSEKLSGVQLATGLSRYSERGVEYVKEIQRMINQNELSAYNKVRSL